MERRLEKLVTDLTVEERASEARLYKMELILDAIQAQIGQITKPPDQGPSSEAIKSKRYWGVKERETVKREWPALERDFRVLSSQTHAKFMKQVKLDYPNFNGECDPAFWINQTK